MRRGLGRSKTGTATSLVHPTAVVEAGARLGTDVRVGAFCYIGADVEIGDNTVFGPHCSVHGPTRIGRDNRFHGHCAIGGEPQDKKYAGEFSSDLAAFGRSVDGLTAGGGGDLPEDMQRGVADALERLSWRADAVVRMVGVIADAPPHLDYQDEPSFADSARLAARRGIKLFTVSASGMDDTGQVVMRQMAQFTGASNMFVLRGGAGPQSVGGGDPQSSCGGTHQQYASGKLDRLILGKVEQELASVDADPMKIAGLGQDEKWVSASPSSYVP